MLDRRIKLRHVQCFLEVARTGSLSKSAEALALTQPAISKTLKEFEDILGVKLVERGRSGANLTAYGQTLLPRATSGLQQLRVAFDSVLERRNREHMTVRVGALPTVAASTLPAAIQRFKTRFPESGIRLVTGPYDFLLEQLRNDLVDIVIGRMADAQKLHGLTFTHLYSEQVVFLVRSQHPLTRMVPFEARSVLNYPVIMPDPDAIIRASVDRVFRVLQIETPMDCIETVAHAFSRVYTLESDAVWIISEGVAAHDLKTGTLESLPIDTDVTKGAVGFTLRAGREPETATRLFAEMLVDPSI